MTELAKLSPRHEAIMRRLVLDGIRQCDVADEFEMTESNLSIIRNSPIWQAKEQDMKLEAFSGHKKELDKLVSPAIQALSDTVVSTDETIKLRSAKEILDRTGFIAGVRVETDTKPVIQMFIPKNWDHPSNNKEDESDSGVGTDKEG